MLLLLLLKLEMLSIFLILESHQILHKNTLSFMSPIMFLLSWIIINSILLKQTFPLLVCIMIEGLCWFIAIYFSTCVCCILCVPYVYCTLCMCVHIVYVQVYFIKDAFHAFHKKVCAQMPVYKGLRLSSGIKKVKEMFTLTVTDSFTSPNINYHRFLWGFFLN